MFAGVCTLCVCMYCGCAHLCVGVNDEQKTTTKILIKWSWISLVFSLQHCGEVQHQRISGFRGTTPGSWPRSRGWGKIGKASDLCSNTTFQQVKTALAYTVKIYDCSIVGQCLCTFWSGLCFFILLVLLAMCQTLFCTTVELCNGRDALFKLSLHSEHTTTETGEIQFNFLMFNCCFVAWKNGLP